MKTSFSSKIWIGYGFLLIFAVILRFHQLQMPFLSEREAAVALQAAGNSQDVSGASGISALLHMVFFAFGESEITARFVPAFFGLLTVLLPFLFIQSIGMETAILASVLLMFDPGQIAFSRQVDGATLTLFGLLLASGFFVDRKAIPVGIALGLALLGSPIVWPALISILLAIWFMYFRRQIDNPLPDCFSIWNGDEIRKGIIALILTVLVTGSGFGTQFAGVAAPFTNLMNYFQGWAAGDGISLFLVLFSFLLYQPMILVIGLIEGIRTYKDENRFNAFLLRLFGFSLLLAIIYPSREMDGILISYLPLLLLAARFLVKLIPILEKPDLTALGQMLLVVLLVPFIWLNFIVLKFPIENQDAMLHLAAVIGAFILLVIASILIRLGWPPSQASTGLWMGVGVLLLVFAFSTAWRSTGLGSYPEAELWNYHGVSDEMDLLRDTASDLSEWNISSRNGINIVLIKNSSSALRWALRDFTSVSDDAYLPNLSNPAIVITDDEEVPSLAQAYRGQDFVITKRTAWSLILPEEWIRWYAFRELPGEKLQKVLWARTDLFPGASYTAPETITPIQ